MTDKKKKSEKKDSTPQGVPLAKTQQWEQWRKEGAIDRAETAEKEREADLQAAYDDSAEDAEGGNRSKEIDKELADDWQHLRRIAITKFPEGAALLGLTPKNRLVAIAHCLGWSVAKISKASRISESTVRRWIDKRPDIRVFIDEFNLRTGDKDIVKEKFSTLEYKAVQCIEAILSDKDDTDAVKRLKLDAAKWVFERSRGKPNQPVEHDAASLRQMIEALGKAQVKLTPEEEAELFDDKTVN